MASILPIRSLVSLLSGRWAFEDIIPALTSQIPTGLPANERNPAVDEDATALERLESWCRSEKVELVDFRDLDQFPRRKKYDTKTYGWPADKSRGQPYGSRPIEQATCAMLHTCDVHGMTKNRGLGIPCHAYVPEDDAMVLCHPIERLVAHGHTGNKFCYGIEVSGRSDWDKESQIQRTRKFLLYFKETREEKIKPKDGEPLKHYVCSHRNSHSSRKRDPGHRIWKDAAEWAIEEHGFLPGPVVGSGTPNPADWKV